MIEKLNRLIGNAIAGRRALIDFCGSCARMVWRCGYDWIEERRVPAVRNQSRIRQWGYCPMRGAGQCAGGGWSQ